MNKKTFILIATGITGIFAIWAGSVWAINTWINASYRGTFGDMFGAVNALFSGLAFAGLIYTIAVQRQELALQRDALKMQTEELEGQKNLSNLQMALGVVNDLIKTKHERFEKVNVQNDAHGFVKGDMAFRDIINKNKGLPPYSKSLVIYIDLHFYILSFIKEYDLTDKQKTLLYRLVRMHCIDEEIKVLYLAANSTPNKYRLDLLESAEYGT